MKIYPCPNCGSYDMEVNYAYDRWKRWFVGCPVCYWCGESHRYKWAAIRAWNRERGERDA